MKKEGSVLGASLLIAGSCIGAGMLALPVITGIAGFTPSIFMFLFAWLFMTSTGLLLLEANLAVGHKLSLISIAEKTLGKTGKVLCWILFLFLFYSLSIAYISASGSILHAIFGADCPPWVGSTAFTLIFAIVLYVGTRQVDYVNRVLMAGLIVSYFLLVILGTYHINPAYLAVAQWKYAVLALPVLVTSFGFHNMIPSLAMYMKGDAKRLRIAVLTGSAIPLLIYLLWEAVMLGIIPLQGRAGLIEALDQGAVATSVLREVVGTSWINTVAQSFALFAIITSFLAQSLSLVDFLADGLKVSKVGASRMFLVALSLVPPFAIAFAYPDIFITALNMAGGFAAVILFGVMPVLMVWVLRYTRKKKTVHMLPLGRGLLVVIFLIAIGIFAFEVAQEAGLSLLPEHVEATP